MANFPKVRENAIFGPVSSPKLFSDALHRNFFLLMGGLPPQGVSRPPLPDHLIPWGGGVDPPPFLPGGRGVRHHPPSLNTPIGGCVCRELCGSLHRSDLCGTQKCLDAMLKQSSNPEEGPKRAFFWPEPRVKRMPGFCSADPCADPIVWLGICLPGLQLEFF